MPSLRWTMHTLWWAMVMSVLWVVPSSALAAQEGLCMEWTEQGSQDGASGTESTAEGWTPDPTTSPCGATRISTPAYNCTAAQLELEQQTRRRARELLATTLQGQGEEPSEALFSAITAAEDVSTASHEEITDHFVAMRSTTFHHRAMCFPRVDGEQCESAPPMAVVVSSASPSPADRNSMEFEVPWRPGDNEVMQPALVELRVGPSDGYHRLPERPPPA